MNNCEICGREAELDLDDTCLDCWMEQVAERAKHLVTYPEVRVLLTKRQPPRACA